MSQFTSTSTKKLQSSFNIFQESTKKEEKNTRVEAPKLELPTKQALKLARPILTKGWLSATGRVIR